MNLETIAGLGIASPAQAEDDRMPDPEASPQLFRRAAVLGAGVMGRAIAAHLANAGLDVLLLDVVPAGASDRNRLADAALAALLKDRPAPLFDPKLIRRVRPGNLEDDLDSLRDVDWVIEAVVERLDVKQALFAKVAQHVGPQTIVSSNTSGIPIEQIALALPAELRPRFLGTHFFNPPRYMHLLELIAHPESDARVLAGLRQFAEQVLGKGVVLAKDRPNFIANRIGAYGMLRTVQLAMQGNYSVEEVEALTGPLVGRPKSATFRTADLVGLDVLLHVAANVRSAAGADPELEVFTPHPVLVQMVEKGLLGEKTGQGFSRKVKQEGNTQIETLDLGTLSYRPQRRAKFPELEALKGTDALLPRLKGLMATRGRGAELAWTILRDTLRYAASVAAEIAGDVRSIDEAMRWGFGWELGPFEIWEGLGLARISERMAAEGRPAPDWVMQHVRSGATRFYAENGHAALALTGSGQTSLSLRPGVLTLHGRGSSAREIARNAGASLWDLSDGVLGLEFHSKMNALGGDAFAMGQKAVALAEQEYEALVVGNEGTHFSAGANLALLLFAALEGEWEDIDLMVRGFQRMTMGLRQCARPVVVAPFSLTLGGGAEVALHGDQICASAELYMGLVEVGVGLIPAGGGTKELYLRMLDAEGPEADPRNAAKRAFEVIGMAKVSGSAHEARGFGFLRQSDAIVLNSDRLLAAAKARALALAQSGYRPNPPRADVPVGGADSFALIEVGLYNFAQAGQISEHDVKIGRKLAGILSGGAHRGAVAATVSEQHLLDLEREAFLSLCGERKSLERIQHMLKSGKALRN